MLAVLVGYIALGFGGSYDRLFGEGLQTKGAWGVRAEPGWRIGQKYTLRADLLADFGSYSRDYADLSGTGTLSLSLRQYMGGMALEYTEPWGYEGGFGASAGFYYGLKRFRYVYTPGGNERVDEQWGIGALFDLRTRHYFANSLWLIPAVEVRFGTLKGASLKLIVELAQ